MGGKNLRKYAFIPLVLVACTGSTKNISEELPHICYGVIDTLGPQSTRTCVTFSSITALDSTILALDCPAGIVTLYNYNDSCISEFGRTGSGPGELDWPSSICATTDSTVFISDFQGISRFDIDGHWLGRPIEYLNNPMFDLQSLNCSTFVAYKHDIYTTEAGTLLDWTISEYSVQGQQHTIFVSDSITIDYLDATEILNRSLFSHAFCSGRNRFFVFDRNEEHYHIDCLDCSDSLLYSIERDTPIIAKNEDELQMEADNIESWLRGSGESDVMEYVYEPRPWREPVKEMWVTDDGEELWVQRGDLDGFMFDIYSTTDGSLIRTSEARIDTSGLWDVSFFIADPDRVYAILEDDDTNQMLVRLAPAE